MRGRGKVDLSKNKIRSALSNGSYLLSRDIDQRGPLVRRLRDLVGDHLSDLGGDDAVSHSERILANRVSFLTLLAEVHETSFVKAKLKCPPSQLADYLHTVGNLNRLCKTLGLQRRAKPVPSLAQYLEAKAKVIDDDELGADE